MPGRRPTARSCAACACCGRAAGRAAAELLLGARTRSASSRASCPRRSRPRPSCSSAWASARSCSAPRSPRSSPSATSPGARWIEWALVLPLAMPGYVFTLFALGPRRARHPLDARRGVHLHARALPVRVPARAGGLPGQSRTLLEAARGLGLSRGAGDRAGGGCRSRGPAILGGVALALMEALADFGTVNLLGVRTFTDAIYRVWFNAFDREAAMQLATLLVSVTLTLLVLERLARGRARYHQLAARGDWCRRSGCAARPRPRRRCWAARARGRRGAGAAGAARRLVGRVDPRRPAARPSSRTAARNSLLLAAMSARARAGRGAAARLRRCAPAARGSAAGGGADGYDRLRPAGLGGGGGGDRAARLGRPPHRRRSLGHRPDLHRNRDRTLLRLPRALPGARLGQRSRRACCASRASSTRRRAGSAPTASTCSRACTCR